MYSVGQLRLAGLGVPRQGWPSCRRLEGPIGRSAFVFLGGDAMDMSALSLSEDELHGSERHTTQGGR